RDFLTKPLDYGSLRALLDETAAELRRRGEIEALERLLEREPGIGGLVGRSKPMRELFRLIELLASSDAPAIVTGESGTGKELVAPWRRELSRGRKGRFAAGNRAAIPGGLSESQIFGHGRGAFTGAPRSRPGCFELANGGTLFLDEIAAMRMAL